ncbi:MAG: hypothetical protein SGPRY_005860, partial [Prymnesium sp.]
EDVSAEIIPMGTTEVPTVKLSAGALQGRVSDASMGVSGRFVPLKTLMEITTGIWMGVLASKGGDGAMWQELAILPLALLAAGGASGAMSFQWLEVERFQVVFESSCDSELAAQLQEGPAPMTWGEFPEPGGSYDKKMTSTRLTALVGALELLQLRGPEHQLATLLAIVTAAAGLPRPLGCAHEISWARGATVNRSPPLCPSCASPHWQRWSGWFG